MAYHLSVATAVGMIALGGVAVEIGFVMPAYLDHALARRRREAGGVFTPKGSARNDRRRDTAARPPRDLTKLAIITALLPILFCACAGADPCNASRRCAHAGGDPSGILAMAGARGDRLAPWPVGSGVAGES